jgi:hypothetical protein
MICPCSSLSWNTWNKNSEKLQLASFLIADKTMAIFCCSDDGDFHFFGRDKF